MIKDNSLLQVVTRNRYFLIPFFLVFAAFSIIVAIHGNSSIFHVINEAHSGFSDILFLCFTRLGNGYVAFVLVFVLLWISFRESLTFLAISLIVMLVIILLKQYFFADFHRPISYFGEQCIRLVPGYSPPQKHTFPSGHTATAFSAYLYLSFLIRNNWGKFGLFLLAGLVGYSRIYLAAHFPADVIGGSVLAILITVPAFIISRKISVSWINQKLVVTYTRAIRLLPA